MHPRTLALKHETNDAFEYFPMHNYIFKCTYENRPTVPKFRGRGTPGTIIIWREDIDHLVEPLPDGNDRLNLVRVNTISDPILITCTYMPTEGAANADYADPQRNT